MLEVGWSDGSCAVLPFGLLRERCMCALCLTARQKGIASEAHAQVAITEAVPYGPNAVQLVFSYGHDRGIFPFAYLRELASEFSTAIRAPRDSILEPIRDRHVACSAPRDDS